ncbi:sugar phosphate nucleotidyltransferase [Paenibacillus sp. YYML68]|uniref:sugar phosphate nucleotidyltransferase n=1 Tax=Paenibacillus sp. YYML68 TaxID=2909250 RepID=UPI00248FC6AE|nr:sugar phosphate nucleotidyltransferase [Paenibacillus sp. YYML68]
MQSYSCAAVLLANGEGERLGALTSSKVKAALPIGGEHRLIDLALSHCSRAGIERVGVIANPMASCLTRHVSSLKEWEDRVTMLPSSPGKGTADAIFRNYVYLKLLDPEYVLIASAEHLYEIDYNELLGHHVQSGALATAAVASVGADGAPRVVRTHAALDQNGRIRQLARGRKAAVGTYVLAGVYVFKWCYLKKLLEKDACSLSSSHDLEADVLPAVLAAGEPLHAYELEGYWREVETPEDVWRVNMELLDSMRPLGAGVLPFHEDRTGKLSTDVYIAAPGSVHQSRIVGRTSIFGRVEHSVISDGVLVGQGSVLRNCFVMPKARIGKNVMLRNAIIGEGAIVESGVEAASASADSIYVVGNGARIAPRQPKTPNLFMPPLSWLPN